MSIFDMISVNAIERFETFNMCVKSQFQFIHDRFWKMIRDDAELSDLHFAVVHSQCFDSSESLLSAYMEQCQRVLSPDVFSDLTKDFDSFTRQQQIVNLDSLDIDPLTREAVYEAMERTDEQHEYYCRMDAYRNEY